jgi:hypothetical protein
MTRPFLAGVGDEIKGAEKQNACGNAPQYARRLTQRPIGQADEEQNEGAQSQYGVAKDEEGPNFGFGAHEAGYPTPPGLGFDAQGELRRPVLLIVAQLDAPKSVGYMSYSYSIGGAQAIVQSGFYFGGVGFYIRVYARTQNRQVFFGCGHGAQYTKLPEFDFFIGKCPNCGTFSVWPYINVKGHSSFAFLP